MLRVTVTEVPLPVRSGAQEAINAGGYYAVNTKEQRKGKWPAEGKR